MSDRYLKLNMSKTEPLILIPIKISSSLNIYHLSGSTFHSVVQVPNVSAILTPLFLSYPTSNSLANSVSSIFRVHPKSKQFLLPLSLLPDSRLHHLRLEYCLLIGLSVFLKFKFYLNF